jgi:hypothetical protein
MNTVMRGDINKRERKKMQEKGLVYVQINS